MVVMALPYLAKNGGQKKARENIFSWAEIYSAQNALELGMVNGLYST